MFAFWHRHPCAVKLWSLSWYLWPSSPLCLSFLLVRFGFSGPPVSWGAAVLECSRVGRQLPLSCSLEEATEGWCCSPGSKKDEEHWCHEHGSHQSSLAKVFWLAVAAWYQCLVVS